MLKEKNERGPRSTSSESWRAFYAPFVLNSIDALVDTKSIAAIYAIHIFEYADRHKEEIVSLFAAGKYAEVLNVGILPVGFEDQDYEIGEVLIVHTAHGDYLVIVSRDERKSDFELELRYGQQLAQKIEMEQFPFRRLVYPV